jgi:predicted DNA repair protein MutK
MSSGFFALLDDIVAITKVAAASLDDVAAQALKAGKKTAGIVIDDAAVTPRYVVGFAADRELPIIAKIAWGSLKNKLLYLLPGALLLSYFAPWAITPLLMLGGAYLCFEGWEKVHAMLHPAPSVPPGAAAVVAPAATEKQMSEDDKIASAIRTDFILSAEIMAITLAAVETPGFWSKAATLTLVGILVTVVVYGAVALIVKADDVGLHLAQKGRTAMTRSFGSGIVHAMPGVLKLLAFVGMLAMLWVGGGIILHGLAEYGLGAIPYAIHDFAKVAGSSLGPIAGFATWAIDATAAGVIGLAIGWVVAKVVGLLGFGGH